MPNSKKTELLREECKKLGIKNCSRMKNSEIIEKLREKGFNVEVVYKKKLGKPEKSEKRLDSIEKRLDSIEKKLDYEKPEEEDSEDEPTKKPTKRPTELESDDDPEEKEPKPKIDMQKVRRAYKAFEEQKKIEESGSPDTLTLAREFEEYYDKFVKNELKPSKEISINQLEQEKKILKDKLNEKNAESKKLTNEIIAIGLVKDPNYEAYHYPHRLSILSQKHSKYETRLEMTSEEITELTELEKEFQKNLELTKIKQGEFKRNKNIIKNLKKDIKIKVREFERFKKYVKERVGKFRELVEFYGSIRGWTKQEINKKTQEFRNLISFKNFNNEKPEAYNKLNQIYLAFHWSKYGKCHHDFQKQRPSHRIACNNCGDILGNDLVYGNSDIAGKRFTKH